MAVFIEFLSRESGKAEAFQAIDEKLCAARGAKVDPKQWYLNWYNSIGFRAALGKSFREIEKEVEDEFVKYSEVEPDPEFAEYDLKHTVEMIEIIRWLDRNYTTSAWSGR